VGAIALESFVLLASLAGRSWLQAESRPSAVASIEPNSELDFMVSPGARRLQKPFHRSWVSGLPKPTGTVRPWLDRSQRF